VNPALLPIKLKIIQEIRNRAGNEPFASYQYVPDIYDFSYQYIYIWQGFQGQQLPTEFSYEPNVVPYISQKPALLSKLSAVTPQASPKKIFFIVEKPSNTLFLNEWWTHQKYSEITDEVKFGDSLTLYEATP
jgi:hypothetical protein